MKFLNLIDADLTLEPPDDDFIQQDAGGEGERTEGGDSSEIPADLGSDSDRNVHGT